MKLTIVFAKNPELNVVQGFIMDGATKETAQDWLREGGGPEQVVSVMQYPSCECEHEAVDALVALSKVSSEQEDSLGAHLAEIISAAFEKGREYERSLGPVFFDTPM